MDVGYANIKKRKVTPNFSFERLKDPAIQTQFEHEIAVKLSSASVQDGSIKYDQVKDALISASKSCLGIKKHQDKKWISDSTKESINLKHELRAKLGPDSILYKIHRNNAKKLCRIDIEKQYEEDHKQIQANASFSSQHFKSIKKLKEARKPKKKS